jgi:hypothetical protein
MEWSKETCGTWLLVSAGYCNPAAKLHPQIGYRRFTPARGGQVRWERRRPRRHTVQPRQRGQRAAPESIHFRLLCPPRAGVAAKRPGVDSVDRVAGGGTLSFSS